MNLERFLKINEEKFESPYEKIFATKILSKVKDIDLSNVSVQCHFQDLDGKNRYCDFAIREGLIKIAIEIDGYDKKNTGHGMTYEEFIDWQRRQASLTAQGWHVLRFANRDVRDAPERCRRHVELLLRDQRSKSEYQANLEAAIKQISNELKNAKNNVVSAEQYSKLKKEVKTLTKQLEIAKSATPLTGADRSELNQLINKIEKEKQEILASHEKLVIEKTIISNSNITLEQEKKELSIENKSMKTTIWAFAVIIIFFILAGAYLIESINQVKPSSPAVVSPDRPAPRTVGNAPSCDSAINWWQAKNNINKLIAITGVIAEYRYMPNSEGSPTWINLGAKYPSEDRVSLVVWGKDRSRFGRGLSENLVSRRICAIGTVKIYRGVPQISLRSPRELIFQ